MTVLRWRHALITCLICVAALFVTSLPAAPVAHASPAPLSPAPGRLIYQPGSNTWLAYPPYANPPTLATPAQAQASTLRVAKYQCKWQAAHSFAGYGIQTQQCSSPWAGQCWAQHDWARACSTYFFIYLTTAKEWYSFTGTFMWQEINGHVAEVRPFGEWKKEQAPACGPDCARGAPDRG